MFSLLTEANFIVGSEKQKWVTQMYGWYIIMCTKIKILTVKNY